MGFISTGAQITCPKCGTRFYALLSPGIHGPSVVARGSIFRCPSCGFTFNCTDGVIRGSNWKALITFVLAMVLGVVAGWAIIRLFAPGLLP